MPYLGSAGPQETGYLLVPDGSGALLDFSPESKALPSFQYKEPVYGRDPMGSVLSKSSNSEEIKLPVFAIKTGERTVMGMITEGDALSSIEVFATGSKTCLLYTSQLHHHAQPDQPVSGCDGKRRYPAGIHAPLCGHHGRRAGSQKNEDGFAGDGLKAAGGGMVMAKAASGKPERLSIPRRLWRDLSLIHI